MRRSALALLCLSSLLFPGCKMLDPDSKLNPNRGDYHDEYDAVGKEGRGNTEREKQVDPVGGWLYSPEARAINRNLGVAD
jgi:hypothetical protein